MGVELRNPVAPAALLDPAVEIVLAAPSAKSGAPTPLRHHAALDGIRAIAVAAVLCFHSGFSWATGGFLGVSTFFTLSGFLITTVLLTEHGRTGRIGIRKFWGRRWRRLMPASLLTLVGVVVFGATVATADQLATLRGDVLATLAYVANWRFILVGRNYAALFSAPSPVQHFWSLAIEEQFYLVFPLLAAGVLAWRRGSRVALGVVIVVLTGLSVASMVLLGNPGGDSTRAYYGTLTRASELLVGALLAVVFFGRHRFRAGVLSRHLAVVIGIVALVVTVWLWHSTTIASHWLYQGGLTFYALGSAALILAALQPGPVRGVLSLRPLVALGAISYGVYLIHWPIFLWLTHERTGLSPWPLFALRVGTTLALAIASYRFLENPIRHQTLARRWRSPTVALIVMALIAAAVVVVTRNAPSTASVLDQKVSATVAAPVRVFIVGDALGTSLAASLKRGGAVVQDATLPQCGLGRVGQIREFGDRTVTVAPECSAQSETWAAAIARFQPDLVLVADGAAQEVADRQLAFDGPFRAPGDPELDRWLTAELGYAADVLTESGVSVVWLSAPVVERPAPPGAAPGPYPETDPARFDRYNALVADVAASRDIRVLDLAAQVDGFPRGAYDAELRPDRVTFSDAGADRITDWLLPVLGDIRDEDRSTPPAPAPPPGDPRAIAGPGPLLPPIPVAGGERVRMSIAGDSFAYALAFGLQEWAKQHGEIGVGQGGRFGCPLARGGSIRFLRTENPIPEYCDWSQRLADMAAERLHVVGLISGVWETSDRLLPGDSKWRHAGDPVFDAYLEKELLTAVDTVGSNGTRVVLFTHPYIDAGRKHDLPSTLPESDPKRMDAVNAVVRRVAAVRPGFVTLIDLQAWFRAQPGGERDWTARPDGIHPTDEFAVVIAEWLAPQLAAIPPRV